MIRLAIIVEGATEEQFVNDMLVDHLRGCRVEATPILIGTSARRRGGNVGVDRLASHFAQLRWSFDAVSSLVDYYGFRKKEDATVEQLETWIGHAVAKKGRRGNDPRNILPYVQKHEFEALLFSDVSRFRELREAPEDVVARLRGIRDRFTTPEDIDDGTETAPSKRIQAVIPTYNKVRQGRIVAGHIGLPKIRAECPRFDAWVGRLEALGTEPPTKPD